jgi:lysine N6-hydroxylase
LLSNAELRSCHFDPQKGTHELAFFHAEHERGFRHRSEGVVFGTGYAPQVPAFVESIRDRICWDDKGRYAQARNYAVDVDASAIFVQNAGLHRHGFTSPDLSLACHRNAELIHEITGVKHYAVDFGTALQDFGPPAGMPWDDVDTDEGLAR